MSKCQQKTQCGFSHVVLFLHTQRICIQSVLLRVCVIVGVAESLVHDIASYYGCIMASRLVEGINNHEKLSKFTYNKYEKVSYE